MIGSIGSGTAARLTGLATGGAAATQRTGRAAADAGTGALSTVQRLVSNGAPVDVDRVAALRTAIRAGSYRADPDAIATAMISGDVG